MDGARGSDSGEWGLGVLEVLEGVEEIRQMGELGGWSGEGGAQPVWGREHSVDRKSC